jgi:hypothetical protein
LGENGVFPGDQEYWVYYCVNIVSIRGLGLFHEPKRWLDKCATVQPDSAWASSKFSTGVEMTAHINTAIEKRQYPIIPGHSVSLDLMNEVLHLFNTCLLGGNGRYLQQEHLLS